MLIDGLLSEIEKSLCRSLHHAVFLLPYAMGGQVERLHETEQVLKCEYTDTGICVETLCSEETYGRLSAYLTKELD